MLTILWPFLIAVLGFVIWWRNPAPTANPKTAEVGRILFIIGTFWTVWLLCGAAFTLGAGAPHALR